MASDALTGLILTATNDGIDFNEASKAIISICTARVNIQNYIEDNLDRLDEIFEVPTKRVSYTIRLFGPAYVAILAVYSDKMGIVIDADKGSTAPTKRSRSFIKRSADATKELGKHKRLSACMASLDHNL